MRRLALLGVLVPVLAFAGWNELPALTGTPQDLVAPDAGIVVAASSGAGGQIVGWSVSDAGASSFLSQAATGVVSVSLYGGACVVGLNTGGQLTYYPASCGTTQALSPGTSFSRLRVLPSGQSVVRFTQTSVDSIFTSTSPAGVYSATSPTWLSTNPRSLEVATVAGVDYAVMNATAASLWISVDGGTAFSVPVSASARDAVPFARLGKPAVLVLTTAAGAALVADLGASGTESSISLPVGFVPQFVAMTTALGGDGGVGYGLMTSVTGDVLSPVPDPSRPGSVWIPRNGAPQLASRVSCVDARWCAAIGDGGVLYALSNDAPPVLSLDAGSAVPGVPLSLTVSASDPDGDPVFISWASGAAQIVPGADPEGRAATITVPGSAECTAQAIPLSLTISDGLAAHEHTDTVMLPLAISTQAWVSPGSVSVAAGDPPLGFTGGTDAGCTSGTFAWSSSDGQSGSGPAFTWTVPETLCSAAGGAFDVSIAWLDLAGHQTSATSAVTVLPWGRPNAPVFDTPATQPAGTPHVWTPVNAAHVCVASPGFPDTQLIWSLPTPPAGVTLTPVDGGLEVNAPDFCASATVSASAVRLVNGDAVSRASDAGTLTVTIVPNPPPLGAGTPFDIGLQVDSGLAFGDFAVDAGCRPLSSLTAEVTLGVPDASIVASTGALPVPGPWSLAIPASCGSGQFELVARLFDDGGFTGTSIVDTVPAESLPVLPGIASPTTLPVRCGMGAAGTLHVESADGGCATPVATWTQVAGPALTQASYSGTSVEVHTQSTGLDVVGQSIDLDVQVGDGSGATATGQHRVLLVAEPFVEISESTAPFPAREEESVLVTVRLVNTTTCEVSGLEVREALDGLTPALESLRLGDAAVSADFADGTLTVRDVSLAGGASQVLSFKARRRLLASGQLMGTVLLHEQVVSLRPPAPMDASGCGCESGGSGAWALLAMLVLARCRGPRRTERLASP